MLVNGVKIQVAPSRDRDLGKVSHTRGCFDFRKDQHESRAYPGTGKKPYVINLIVGDEW